MSEQDRFLHCGNEMENTMTLIRVRGGDDPVYFLISSLTAHPTDRDRWDQDARYYYEEHTCPRNWIGGDVKVVIDGSGDTDPHGVFDVVGTVSLDEVRSVVGDGPLEGGGADLLRIFGVDPA